MNLLKFITIIAFIFHSRNILKSRYTKCKLSYDSFNNEYKDMYYNALENIEKSLNLIPPKYHFLYQPIIILTGLIVSSIPYVIYSFIIISSRYNVLGIISIFINIIDTIKINRFFDKVICKKGNIIEYNYDKSIIKDLKFTEYFLILLSLIIDIFIAMMMVQQIFA